ncbi:MurR/RpiR family transcriptional regulator [Brevibacillus sp. NRS-1366]|uniref:MurR/RpiR family transcriptional regulator n=1 Tax=Brevibacillus sp. NRS-1366 TaxID=3233899 RepID=UPI003D1D4E40
MQKHTDFEQLLKEKFNGLSIAQKKVAQYVIEYLERSAFQTAVQIAREAEVSETTVIRLSYALGFSGFSDMQQMIREHFLQGTNIGSTQQDIDIQQPSTHTNPFVRALEQEISILQRTLANLNEAELHRAVDTLYDAEHVLIIGHRGSYSAASWISFMLGMMRENVHLCPSGGQSYEKLFITPSNSVVLVISFPRYSRDSVHLAETAKNLGSTIIAVTDRLLSPVGRLADITLTTEINTDVESGAASMSSVISLLHLLALGVIEKGQEQVKTRLKQLEQIYHKQGVFIE